MAKMGTYTVKNKNKYKGHVDKVTYRSSWEKFYMEWLDCNANVIQWHSEDTVIPYFSIADGKKRRYFMDFWFKLSNGKEFYIEVKPKKETVPPTKPVLLTAKAKARYMNEIYTWSVNQCKWKAAKELADKKNITFRVLTEDGLRKLGMKI